MGKQVAAQRLLLWRCLVGVLSISLFLPIDSSDRGCRCRRHDESVFHIFFAIVWSPDIFYRLWITTFKGAFLCGRKTLFVFCQLAWLVSIPLFTGWDAGRYGTNFQQPSFDIFVSPSTTIDNEIDDQHFVVFFHFIGFFIGCLEPLSCTLAFDNRTIVFK